MQLIPNYVWSNRFTKTFTNAVKVFIFQNLMYLNTPKSIDIYKIIIFIYTFINVQIYLYTIVFKYCI